MATRPNRLRELREARGLSQVALAEASSLSRQSVGAIEAGRAMPAVDVALRLARALGCQVEALFGVEPAERVGAVLASSHPGRRAAVAFLDGRWVAHPLDGAQARQSADALIEARQRAQASLSLLQPLAVLRENVLLAGCATGLGPLCDRLNATTGPGRFRWLPCSSQAALEHLRAGVAHVAGVHGDEATTAPGRGHAVVTLARWEVGLVTRPGDAGRIKTLEGLLKPRVRLVSREPGSGARALLERRAREHGVPLRRLHEAPLVASGHLEVAQAIAMQAADAGVATRDAALAYGLRFVPLAEERFDLVLPRALLTEPRVARLLDVLASAAMREELSALGYDVSQSGRRVPDGGRHA